ncbi:MAG: peptidoglycan DD-metalloendopeptidase family protein [Clostridiales Family XIII bacterium]|jgi:murein DD-endopeptidase MepM/ murein hydrolase activator NlpD|nr:peptidoglycan DD-metalloendopeptidase family protein [Clostridiales Family XIII bacterium]
MKSKSKSIVVTLSLIFVFSMLGTGQVFAESLQDQLQAAKEAQEQAQDEYDAKKATEDNIASQIDVTVGDIYATQGDIDSLQGEITKKEEELTDASLQVSKLQKDYDKQNRELGKRLRMMYESGDQSVIEVLLGSANVVDFLENIDMIKRIYKSDAKLLEDMDASLAQLEEQKNQVKEIKDTLTTHQSNLSVKKQTLEEQESLLQDLYSEAQAEASEAKEHLDAMAAESAYIQAQINATYASGGGYADYGGGTFGWPVYGPITALYGDAGYAGHTGLDIGVPLNTPVVAAADGKVITAITVVNGSYGGGGYGNYIVIDHGVDPNTGRSVQTLYGHNTTLLVSPGQIVTRGQVIAYSGSTGWSTGPHVHFEVRVNGYHTDPLGWL